MRQDYIEIALQPIYEVPSNVVKRKSPQIPNWQPACLKLPFFIAAICVTLLHSAMCATFVVLHFTNSTMLTFQASSVGAFFFWTFIPIILAVVPGLIWEAVHIETCRLQPYRDLARRGGTTLKDSLSQTYLTMFSWVVPYHALSHPGKHTGVALISVAYLLSYSVLPAVTGAMLKIRFDLDAGEGTAELLVYLVGVGFLVSMSTVVFAIAAFLVLRRQKSGLYTDPGSLAGLGALVAESNLLNKFRAIRSLETQEGIDQHLGDLQLGLEYTGGLYQITLLDPNQPISQIPEQRWRRDPLEAHPWWLRGWTYVGLTIVMIIPFVVVYQVIYQQTYNAVLNSDLLEINGDAFAIKICTTIIALISTSIYANWHLYVAMLQPYHKLAERSQKKLKGSSIALRLDFTGSAISNLLQRGQYLGVWLMAVCALLTQLSVIIQPAIYQNLAFSTILALQNSEYSSQLGVDDIIVPAGVAPLRIISWVFSGTYGVFALIALVLVLKKKRQPFLPRKPFTLSSQILYLCHGTDFLNDVKGMQSWSKKARDAKLKQNGHKYALGWIADDLKDSSYIGIDRVENVGRHFEYPKASPDEFKRERMSDGAFERLHPSFDDRKTRRDAGWPDNAR